MISEENIIVNEIEISYKVLKNVESRTCNVNTSEMYFHYYTHLKEENEEKNILLLFETVYDSAFGHWIYESAIYLPYYKELKKIYPELKLLVKMNPKRTYKKLLFDVFGITDENIYWLKNNDTNSTVISYENIPINNICISINNIFLNTVPIINYDIFKKLIVNFKESVLYNLELNNYIEKTTEYLFFPRSKNGENYKPNDRVIDYSSVYKVLKDKQVMVYDTKNTENFKQQIELLISSKNIFLDWGSAFMVNGLFCRNSDIYIYNFNGDNCKYPPFSLLCDINDNNKFHYITPPH